MAITKVMGWVNVGLVICRLDDGSIKTVLANVGPAIVVDGATTNFDRANRGDWFDFSQITGGTAFDEVIADGSDVRRRVVGREIPDGTTVGQMRGIIVTEVLNQSGAITS